MTDPRPGADRPPPWVGAPGYTPGTDDLPPHAPMPGAPPYPATQPEPAAPPPARTRFGAAPLVTALGAAAVWAAVNLALVLLVAGPPGTAGALGELVGALLVATVPAALVVRLATRRRGRPFWQLLLIAAPVFWVLRAFTNLPLG